MSRLTELKKHYPELNLSIFDFIVRMDKSNSYKYVPLLCKIFNKRFNAKDYWSNDDYSRNLEELKKSLDKKGIDTEGLTPNQLFTMNYLCEYYSPDTFDILNEFMKFMDKGVIENKDVTSYKDLEEIRSAVSLTSIKELNKELEGQVIKEFEDDKWVIVRPLTFAASAKYGSSTRWCTTYQKEKQYFEKYWRGGILVYFINKQTGYKFACFKHISEKDDISFWNAEDSRIDFFALTVDDYLYPIIKSILNSPFTNKNLSSDEIQTQVHKECLSHLKDELFVLENPRMEMEPVPVLLEELDRMADEIAEDIDFRAGETLIEAAREYNQMVGTVQGAPIIPIRRMDAPLEAH